MVIDVDTHRDPEGFPVDHPLDALKQDHDIVRRLFERYHEIPIISAHIEIEEKQLFPLLVQASVRVKHDCNGSAIDTEPG